MRIEHYWNGDDRAKTTLGEKTVPVLLSLPHVLYRLACKLTRASAAQGRRQAACNMAWPF